MKLPSLPKIPTSKQVLDFLSHLTERGLVLLVIIYVAVSVGRSVSKNYQANQEIADLEKKIAEVEQEKAYYVSLTAYYRTKTFKELKAREELGLKLPDETVIAVPLEQEDEESQRAAYAAAPEAEPEKPIANYRKWWNYFFSG